jgi:hypothetical protein
MSFKRRGRPFPALSLDTLVQIASMTASMEDMHRLACVSKAFREAVEAVCSSRAADMGIRARPPGFSWWSAVRESVMDTTGLDCESFFEDLHDEVKELRGTPAGAAGTIGGQVLQHLSHLQAQELPNRGDRRVPRLLRPWDELRRAARTS